MNVEPTAPAGGSCQWIGLHLRPFVDPHDARRPSVLAELDTRARLVRVAFAETLDDVAEHVGDGPALLAVDQPLWIENPTGRRDLERLLAWCDVPTLPVSLRRLATLYGGARGVDLRARLAGVAVDLRETLPELVLRQVAWEAAARGGLPLEAYREAWLGVRPPRYRPKGDGRAAAAGLVPAWNLLATVVDMAGWAPEPGADDWAAIRDAAVLDAVAAAYAGWRAGGERGSVTIRCADGTAFVTPADANLAGRLALDVDLVTGTRVEVSLPADGTPRTPA